MQNKIADQKGFTLIEIIVSLAILAVIASLGLFISMDFFKNSSTRSEQNVIVSLLQNARSQSLDNIDQVRHGIHFENSPSLKYTIFEESSYIQNNPNNLVINSSYNTSITNPALPFDIIFDQLSGCLSSAANNCSASPVTITGTDGKNSYNIKINSEGQIDW